jgi:hypothetical protein
MNQLTVALVAFVLVASVTLGDCQSTATIKCYACQGTYDPITGVYHGCDHPFNTTQLQTVTCNGVCVKAIQYDPVYSSGGGSGSFDTVTRGCTVTQPRLGCYQQDDANPTQVTCTSTCSTDLCNSADALRTTAAISVGFLSMLAAVIRRY